MRGIEGCWRGQVHRPGEMNVRVSPSVGGDKTIVPAAHFEGDAFKALEFAHIWLCDIDRSQRKEIEVSRDSVTHSVNPSCRRIWSRRKKPSLNASDKRISGRL